jgi:hypothetical protein
VPARLEDEPAIGPEHLVDAVPEGEAVVEDRDAGLLGWNDRPVDGGETHMVVTPGIARAAGEPRLAPAVERGQRAEAA